MLRVDDMGKLLEWLAEGEASDWFAEGRPAHVAYLAGLSCRRRLSLRKHAARRVIRRRDFRVVGVGRCGGRKVVATSSR